MEFLLDPSHGVGPIRLGMAAEDALVALASLGTVDQGGLVASRPSELSVGVEFGSSPARGRVNAIEIWRPSSNDDVVRFLGVDLFGQPAREVARQLGGPIELAAEEAGFVAREVYLALWRPFAADDDAEEIQGHYFQSVLLALPGYDDTPAEVAARLAAAGQPGHWGTAR
jgi:hypothetical protein